METVKSADGTVIAYDRIGAGPALIVSVGAFCTRHAFVAPPELRRRFTVVTEPSPVQAGATRPPRSSRTLGEQAAATPGARLQLIDAYPHRAPPEATPPVRTVFSTPSGAPDAVPPRQPGPRAPNPSRLW